ncbi:MAG: transcriptional regulator [Treponema sp.]|nr:transcriptional regulator [Treponema sp.]
MHSGYVRHLASTDFTKAKGKALLSQIQNFLNADRDNLLSFHDVKDILKPKNEVYMGNKIVPIKQIAGSEGRYHDFNKFFLPRKEHLRYRWERVDEAHIKDIILPPIRLYEIGGIYFVRDGNHRVSVARMQKVEFIDAEVISLSTEIRLDPMMTTEDLRDALIDYEKKIFYTETYFGDLTDYWDLHFSSPGRYDVIYNHILVHKYYLNEDIEEEIPFNDAIVSWYNNVYNPVISIINEYWLLANFPGRTEADLYVWIIKHWDFLKHKYGKYSLPKAALNFTKKYGQDKGKFFRLLALLINKTFRK